MKFLIIPIGPPGSGKSTLREYLREYCLGKGLEFRSTNRDEVFQSIRINNSLRKTRKMLYDKLQEFYVEVNSLKSCIIYIDSVNAKEDIRIRYDNGQNIFLLILIFTNKFLRNIDQILKNIINK